MVVVCLGVVPYEQSERLALYRAYARCARVVYVEPDPSRDGTDANPFGVESGGITVVRISATFPGGRLRVIAVVNRWLGLRKLLRRMRARYREPLVLVVQRPDQLPTLRGLPADLCIYEVVDDYAALSSERAVQRRLQRAHRRAIASSDVASAST